MPWHAYIIIGVWCSSNCAALNLWAEKQITQLMESTIKQANIHITTRRTSKQTKKQGYNERKTDTNKCLDSHTHALAEVRFAFNVIKTCWQSGSVRNGVLCGIGFSPRCSAQNSVQKFWFFLICCHYLAYVTTVKCLGQSCDIFRSAAEIWCEAWGRTWFGFPQPSGGLGLGTADWVDLGWRIDTKNGKHVAVIKSSP